MAETVESVFMARVVELEAKVADLERRLAEEKQRAEARFDCHAGPGTTDPACGGCVSCLTRALDETVSTMRGYQTRLEMTKAQLATAEAAHA